MNYNMPYFVAIGLVPFLLLYEVGGGLHAVFLSFHLSIHLNTIFET